MNIQGFVDVAAPDRIVGWVMDGNDPDRALMVEVVLDGRIVATATANEMRVDLRQADIGSGLYGFSAVFPTAIPVADVERMMVSALGADGERAPIARFASPARFLAEPADPAACPAVDHAARPVFVLGAPRSGTSVVTYALRLNTRYLGPQEGHVLDLVAPLAAVIDKFYALKTRIADNPNMVTMLSNFPRSYFEAALSSMFLDAGSKFFATPCWVDKTPTSHMIRAAPRLATIWPRARFIFMRRRGFENVLSQERKFRSETFQTHCSRWADCMAAWLDVRPHFAGRAIEIDQYMLAREPALAADLIADLLSLEPAERHDVARFLTVERIEKSGDSSDRVEQGMPESWDAERRRIFTETCLPLFAPFGYAEDSRYFLPLQEPVTWRRI